MYEYHDEALFIRIDLGDTLTPDLYEWLLRPFWAEEYQRDAGAPGLPARLKQFMDTRSKAAARLEGELGIRGPEGHQCGFEDFLFMYENNGLPVTSPYSVSSMTIVDTLV